MIWCAGEKDRQIAWLESVVDEMKWHTEELATELTVVKESVQLKAQEQADALLGRCNVGARPLICVV